jgi:hypothetical protein
LWTKYTAQGAVKRYKAYKPWAKAVALKARPKDPLKPRKRQKADADPEQDLALQIRHVATLANIIPNGLIGLRSSIS